MDEKIYELMTKMYSEFSEFRQETNGRFDKLENEVGGLKSDVLRLENKLDDRTKVLFDGYNQNTEILARLEKKVDSIDEKVDRHDIKIQVIEGGKAV